MAAWEDPAVNAACNSFFQDTLPVLDQSYLRPRFHGYLNFQKSAGLVLQAFLSTGGDPRRVCSELDQLYNKRY